MSTSDLRLITVVSALPQARLLGAKGSEPKPGTLCDVYLSKPQPNQIWGFDAGTGTLRVEGDLLLSVSQSRPRLDGGRGGYQVDVYPVAGQLELWQRWDLMWVPNAGASVIASAWTPPDGKTWVLGVVHGQDVDEQPVDVYPAPDSPLPLDQRHYPAHQLWQIVDVGAGS